MEYFYIFNPLRNVIADEKIITTVSCVHNAGAGYEQLPNAVCGIQRPPHDA